MARAYLLEWARHFFQSKDLILRKIKEIKEEPTTLLIIHKDDSTIKVIPAEKLEDAFKIAKKEEKTAIITFNTKENFKFLTSNWNNISEHPQLTTYFINPEALTEKKWVINPHIHNRIADSKNLKTGLKTMFKSVEEVTPKIIKSLIKEI